MTHIIASAIQILFTFRLPCICYFEESPCWCRTFLFVRSAPVCLLSTIIHLHTTLCKYGSTSSTLRLECKPEIIPWRQTWLQRVSRWAKAKKGASTLYPNLHTIQYVYFNPYGNHSFCERYCVWERSQTKLEDTNTLHISIFTGVFFFSCSIISQMNPELLSSAFVSFFWA